MKWLFVAAVLVGCGSEAPQALPPWFGDATKPPVVIRGVVHGASEPVTVALTPDVPDGHVLDARPARDDGSFELGVVRAGRYTVQAYGASTVSRVVELDAAQSMTIDLYVYPCRQVTGRALVSVARPEAFRHSDDPAFPVAGATIEVAGRAVATTGLAGHFRFCGPRDDFTLVVRAAGFEPVMHYIGDEYLPEVFLDRGHSVEGVLTQHGGAPVAGAGVQPVRITGIDHEPYDLVPITATTDWLGRFHFDQVATNRHAFRVVTGDATFDVARSFDLDPRTPVRLPMPTSRDELASFGHGGRWARDMRTIRVDGRVLHRGQPVPDAEVAVQADDGVYEMAESTRTRADGSFSLDVITGSLKKSERLTLVSRHAGLALEGTASLVVRGDAPPEPVAIDVGRGATVVGKVVDETGAPIENVGVSIDPRYPRDRARTDASGAFTLRIPRTGVYWLHAYDDYQLLPTVDAPPPRVDVTDVGGAVEGITLRVERRAAHELHGTVVDEAGNPVHAKVWGYSRGYGAPVDAAADGSFSLTGLETPPFLVSVRSDDGRVALSAPIDSGDHSIVRMVVRRPASLIVHCGEMHVDSMISLANDRANYAASCDRPFLEVPQGRYRIFATAREGVALTTVDLGSTPVEVTLSLLATRVVHARVVEEPGDVAIGDVSCEASIRVEPGYDARVGNGDSKENGELTLRLPDAAVSIDCPDSDLISSPTTLDVATRDAVTIRLVRRKPDALDIGVVSHPHPHGARVTAVADEAAAAGLKPGDIVEAADDVLLAGLSSDAMSELAFRVVAGKTVRWKVRRGAATLVLTATAH